MISIRISKSGLSMSGHVGYAPAGQDIVCSAISAITLTLIEGLKVIVGTDIEFSEESGNVSVRWQKLNEKGKVLIDSWFLGICRINETYNCIQFI